jgi:hypothetical protein
VGVRLTFRKAFRWGLGQGGIAMMTELDAMTGSYIVTTVSLYGSAAMLILSVTVAMWLCRSTESRTVLRTRTAS